MRCQTNEITSGVQSIGKQEISDKVEKGLRQRPNLAHCEPDLLEPNGRVTGASGDGGSRALLLKEEPPYP